MSLMITEKNDEIGQGRLITNRDVKFLNCLETEFGTCDEFKFVIAFVRMSGIQLIIDQVQKMSARGVKGEIITSNYLFSTQPHAVKKLIDIPNINVKIVDVTAFSKGLHAKSYYFRKQDNVSLYVGSNNLTKSGLKENTEWSLHTIISNEDEVAQQFLTEFSILQQLPIITLEQYHLSYEDNRYRTEIEASYKKELELLLQKQEISEVKQNEMQLHALKNLYDLRKSGETRALVIAATGTGKTYLSAFDVKAFNSNRLLFVVHSKEIANGAIETYKSVFGTDKTYGFVGDGKYEIDCDFVFALPQTLRNNLKQLDSTMFDYIVFDEAHRIAGELQQTIFNYFKPKFLLGMTATPERMDGKDIYMYFDENIAADVRLKDALTQGYLTPFHYFGIADDTEYTDTDLTNSTKLAKKLSVNHRVDIIVENMEKYDYAGETKRRCLGFCVTKEHAYYMAEEFNKRGYHTIVLTGENTTEERKMGIDALMSEMNPLEFIFTVDIFNEGVDIPNVNLILMLRPTQSATIFIQQLGRGLRKSENKEFLTVLDFIGNHSNNYVMSYAFNNGNMYDPSTMKANIKSGHWGFNDDVHISLDKVAKERIFNSIEKIDFSSKRQLEMFYQNFKSSLATSKKQILLMDYFLAEAAPDPLKFNHAKNKNYYSFVNDLEKEVIFDLSNNVIDVLNYLMELAPLRRSLEIEIIKHLLKENMHISTLEKVVLPKTTLGKRDFDSAIQFLCRVGFSEKEKETMALQSDIIRIENDIVYLNIKYIASDDELVLHDFVDYLLNRYYQEIPNQTETLVKYQSYSYSNVALVLNTNIQRSIKSWREGVCEMDGFQIFINLHKHEGIDESINYKDEFISPSFINWDSQNKTSQSSSVGQKMISYVNDFSRGWDIFVRKSKDKLYGETPRFIYLGKGVPVEYSGNKPIQFKIKLIDPVPDELYEELN